MTNIRKQFYKHMHIQQHLKIDVTNRINHIRTYAQRMKNLQNHERI